MLIDMCQETEETEGDAHVVHYRAEEEMVADLAQEERGVSAILLVVERGLQEMVDQRKHKKNSMPKWTTILEMGPNKRRMSMALQAKLQLQLKILSKQMTSI